MHLSTSLAPTSLKTTLYLHLWFRCQTCLWLWFVSQIPALPQSVRQPAPDIYTLSGLVQQEEHYSLKTWNKINKYISIFYSNNLDLSILKEIFCTCTLPFLNALGQSKDLIRSSNIKILFHFYLKPFYLFNNYMYRISQTIRQYFFFSEALLTLSCPLQDSLI